MSQEGKCFKFSLFDIENVGKLANPTNETPSLLGENYPRDC